MGADYDSEADALSIELARFKRHQRQEPVDDDNCQVGIVADRPVDIELLCPAKHLDLLAIAAARYDLDGGRCSRPRGPRSPLRIASSPWTFPDPWSPDPDTTV
jgi:hypothetical protein